MAEKNPQAVVIIPAFNEEPRVESVVRVVLGTGLFTRVLVVDDGSGDDTAHRATEAGAEVISHDVNRGKPQAMLTGLKATNEPVICFLDADLLNASQSMISKLVLPVIEGTQTASLAVFTGGRIVTTIAQKISPLISGQRCITRQALSGFKAWDSGFGIETEINAYLKGQGIIQLIVEWEGASHVMKEEKRGFFPGLLARFQMYWQIFVSWLRTKSS